MFTYRIDSGFSLDELIPYFIRMATTFHKEELEFYGDGWEVRLIEKPDAIHHSIILPRTLIEFSGKEEACQRLIESYRKAFMRGGA